LVFGYDLQFSSSSILAPLGIPSMARRPALNCGQPMAALGLHPNSSTAMISQGRAGGFQATS
jgi:hypothetical protein